MPHIPPCHITPLFRAKNPTLFWKHCWYCGVLLSREPKVFAGKKPKNYRTRDHLIPRSLFPRGTGHQGNTVFACHKCNTRKGHWSLEEFRRLVQPKGGLFWAEMIEINLGGNPRAGRPRVQLAPLRG